MIFFLNYSKDQQLKLFYYQVFINKHEAINERALMKLMKSFEIKKLI